MTVSTALGQATLSKTPGSNTFAETFDNAGSALPTGFAVRTNASSSSTGTASTFNTGKYFWTQSTGGFYNVASADGLTSGSLNSEQNASTDRAVGIKQTVGGGLDPGAALNLSIADTVGLSNFSLSVKLQTVKEDTGTTNYVVQYGIGATPSSFTTVATYTSGSANFNKTVTATAFDLSAIENQANNIVLRVAAVTAATPGGSDGRDLVAVDDFSLTYTATPEPTTAVLACLAAGGVLIQRRRRDT